MDQLRALTRRRVPLKTKESIEELNPVLRGWGHHYKRARVRKLFHRLDGWIVLRIRAQPATGGTDWLWRRAAALNRWHEPCDGRLSRTVL